MTAYPIENPFASFANVLGFQITGGKIFIGVPGMDPETNPQAVYWDADSTIPAAQPLTMKGGYVARNGTPARAYTGGTYSLRVYDFLGNVVFYEANVSADIGFQQAGAGAIARTAQDKLREILSPADFGVIGDGATDDTAAWILIAAYVNSLPFGAAIKLGRVKSKISGSVITFTKPVAFIGEGELTSQVILAASASFAFSGIQSNYGGTQFIFERVGFRVSGAHSSGPLKISYADGGSGTVPCCVFRDSSVQCADDGGSFAYGLWLENVSLPYFSNFRIEGDRDSYPITSLVGLKVTGSGADYAFDGCSCYFVQTGISGYGDLEGIRFDKGTMVAVRTGIDWQTSSGFNPWFRMSGTHINAENRSVYLRGMVEFIIEGNELYCQNADGGGTGTMTFVEVDTQYNAGVNLNSRIVGNMFQGDGGGVGLANTTGIKIDGEVNDSESLIIANNQFQSMSVAVSLGAGCNGVLVADTNRFSNVTTTVVNSATAGLNVIAQTIVSGTTYSVTDNHGNCRKFGSIVVMLNASGVGSIAYGSLGNFSAFRSGIVTNGEPGIQGSAAFVASQVTSNESTLNFSVIPNPGAISVRVNFSAEGVG